MKSHFIYLLILLLACGKSPESARETEADTTIVVDSTFTPELKGTTAWRTTRMLSGVILEEIKPQEAIDSLNVLARTNVDPDVYYKANLRSAPFWNAVKADTSGVILEYALSFGGPSVSSDKRDKYVYLIIPDPGKIEIDSTYSLPLSVLRSKVWKGWPGSGHQGVVGAFGDMGDISGDVRFLKIRTNHIVAELNFQDYGVQGKYLFRIKN